MNHKVGPLSGDESAALAMLGHYYGMPPAAIFRYALAMLFRATQMEVERNEKANQPGDTGGLRNTADPAASDTESPDAQ